MKPRTQAAIDGVLGLDRLVHEPARLAILTVLNQAEFAEFGFLEMACRLSKGNLSSHLSKLEAGGLITIEKRFAGKRPQTRAAITPAGRQAIAVYREHLKALINEVPGAAKEEVK
jgi:DNA-binding transcriptional ArsR family regulator